MGFDLTHVDVGGGLGRGLRRLALDPPGQHELHDAGVRQRRGLHHRRRLPHRGAADAPPHLGVGPRPHRAPLAAADQRHRRRVADRAGGARSSARTRTRCWWRWRRTSRALTARPGRRGVPRRRVRQGAGAGVLRQRRLLAARQGRRRAALPRDAQRAAAAPWARSGPRSPRSPRTSRRRWWTATSATSRCSSRCPTTGPSTSSSRSCRSTGCTSSRPGAGTLQDVTCDSDGVIDRFTGGRKGKPSLELHPVRRGRAVHPRHLPHRRLPGDPGRPAQPLRRHQRRPRPADRPGLRDHRPGPRRHGDRGAQLRAVPRLRPAGHVPPQGERAPRTSRRQEANSFIADYVAGLEGYTYLEGDVPVG